MKFNRILRSNLRSTGGNSDTMAADPSDIETSDQYVGSTWILTESHEYLKNVLSYLPAVQLFKCARVCKQWKKEVDRMLASRSQLGWVSYNYDTAPDGGHDEHELGHFGRNLDECIQSVWSVPQYVLMFTELSSRTDYTIGTRQKSHFGGNSRSGLGKRRQDVDQVLSLINERLPAQCELLCLETPGTVGTYTDMKLAGESEGEGGATAILLPRMQGVDIKILKITRKSSTLYNIGDELSIQEGIRMAPTKDVKCVLLFGVGNSPTAQFIPTILQKSFRDSYGWDPVIAGAIADDLLTKKLTEEEASMKTIGMSFSGPNVHAASILLGTDICTKERVKKELQRLKKVGLSEKKSIAFMFACVGRGIDFHEQESAESEAFHELFPNTPLFGFFGNGEFGCDNMACGKPVSGELGSDKMVCGKHVSNKDAVCQSRLPDLMHGYTTIFCMLSFGPGT